MDNTFPTLEIMREINAAWPGNRFIDEWKSGGRPVFAFQCTYVPEEIIYAAGILPVRLSGSLNQSEVNGANAMMYPNTCSFIRSCLETVLDKKYAFLDGLAAAATCDCTRRLADVWDYNRITPFVHVLSVPRKITERAINHYRAELAAFQKHLEQYTGRGISADNLNQAIAVYNRRRQLLRELNELRKQDPPPLSGAEAMEILNASVMMPPLLFNELLTRLLAEIRQSSRRLTGKFRLMVNGSPLHNPAFIRAIEEMGGLVVIDELCTGLRYWWEGVDPDPDPLTALARRYLHNFPCARMEPSHDRLERLMRLVRDYRVTGVINQVVHYCIPQTMEQPTQRHMLEDAGVSVLELDLEYGTGNVGQVSTRVQAFLEMLERRGAPC